MAEVDTKLELKFYRLPRYIFSQLFVKLAQPSSKTGKDRFVKRVAQIKRIIAIRRLRVRLVFLENQK